MSTRTGKIARLPHHIREELNLRLRDNQPFTDILLWLNALPNVQSVLAAQFSGMPVTEQNLSAWRTGSFKEWLSRREARDFLAAFEEEDPLEEEPELDDYGDPSPTVTHKLLRWLTIQYAAVAADLCSVEDPEERWRRLRQFSAELARLQSADLRSRSLRIRGAWLSLGESKAAHQERRERLSNLSRSLPHPR